MIISKIKKILGFGEWPEKASDISAKKEPDAAISKALKLWQSLEKVPDHTTIKILKVYKEYVPVRVWRCQECDFQEERTVPLRKPGTWKCKCPKCGSSHVFPTPSYDDWPITSGEALYGDFFGYQDDEADEVITVVEDK